MGPGREGVLMGLSGRFHLQVSLADQLGQAIVEEIKRITNKLFPGNRTVAGHSNDNGGFEGWKRSIV